eukprot:8933615-Pyramimonas_sp.AAC.1
MSSPVTGTEHPGMVWARNYLLKHLNATLPPYLPHPPAPPSLATMTCQLPFMYLDQKQYPWCLTYSIAFAIVGSIGLTFNSVVEPQHVLNAIFGILGLPSGI